MLLSRFGLTSQWFVRRRGRAIAVVVLGLAASNALLPPLTQSLIGSVGWREAYVALGVMVWILLIPAAILVVRNRPEEVGLYPDGASRPVEEPRGEKASIPVACAVMSCFFDPKRARRDVGAVGP